MGFGDDFPQDREFRKLLARRADVDLTAAALELARDAYPQLDFGEVFRWIDDRAGELSGPLAGARSEADALAELGRCIAGTHAITGSSESYDLADSSFLNRVIVQKTGLPISLSVLYMAVAERAGLTLAGVAAPTHFLTRFEAAEGPLFVDPFHAGKIRTLAECMNRVQAAADLSQEHALSVLEPVGPRVIIIRMLNNLKALYARQENWQPACVVQRRLSALEPASYGERRDLGLISLKADLPGQALKLLEACLGNSPDDEKSLLEQQIAECRKQLARWN